MVRIFRTFRLFSERFLYGSHLLPGSFVEVCRKELRRTNAHHVSICVLCDGVVGHWHTLVYAYGWGQFTGTFLLTRSLITT